MESILYKRRLMERLSTLHTLHSMKNNFPALDENISTDDSSSSSGYSLLSNNASELSSEPDIFSENTGNSLENSSSGKNSSDDDSDKENEKNFEVLQMNSKELKPLTARQRRKTPLFENVNMTARRQNVSGINQ